ncbi:hypothetical protein HanPSC8_Chr15g0687401 [Helianthus annuus]|nr:hypothetical protein HanPSC8_Chr15g0687401 [Helianthus annuus]
MGAEVVLTRGERGECMFLSLDGTDWMVPLRGWYFTNQTANLCPNKRSNLLMIH